MRLTLLAAFFVLFLHTAFAAIPASTPAPTSTSNQASAPVPAATPNPRAKNTKKGTLGFISGLLLGPVGLGGVFLFTHNHAQRKAAKKGCVIFATVVVTVALCWLIVLAAKGGGGTSSGSSASGSLRGAGGVGSSSGGSFRGFGGGSHNGNGSNPGNWPDINFSGGSASPTPKKKQDPCQMPDADWLPGLFLNV